MSSDDRKQNAHRFLEAVSLGHHRARLQGPAGAPLVLDGSTAGTEDDLRVSLTTADGLRLGVVIESDDLYVESDIAVLGSPSIALAAGDCICLIYLFDVPVDEYEADRIAGRLAETLDARAGSACPLIGFGVCDFAREVDEELLDSPLLRFSYQHLIDRLTTAPMLRRKQITGRAGDALLLGEFSDPAIAARKITLGLSSKGREAKRWKAVEMMVETFLRTLSGHEEGPKDGKAILQGEPIDGDRRAASMRANYIIGFDIDNGTSMLPVIRQVASWGYTGVIYTTHSHLKPESEIAEAAFNKFCKESGWSSEVTAEKAGAYLLAKGKITEDLVGTITGVERQHLRGGMKLIVKHAPMPRFRLIFILDKPFIFSERGGSHGEAMQEWASKYMGLAHKLGLKVDESCTDSSRLFYLPRHSPGADHSTFIILGDLLDLDAVQIEPSRSIAVVRRPALPAEGEIRSPPLTERVSHSLPRDHFGAVRGHLELADLFRANASERIRADKRDRLEVECPNDGAHSDPGNPDDRACMVMNASDNNTGRGFVFVCQHNSCKSIISGQMLNKAVDAGWFNDADLADPQFQRTPPAASLPVHRVDQVMAPPTKVILHAADDHTELVQRSLAALRAMNAARPYIFLAAAGLVRVVPDHLVGGVKIEHLTVDGLRHELGKAVSYHVVRGAQTSERRLPDGIVRDILAADDAGLPVLKGVVHTPVFVRVGSDVELVDKPGYHQASGYYYDPGENLDVPTVADTPTGVDLERAMELLFDHVFVDFPFDDSTGGSASRAHALALLLQFPIRDLIKGPTPIYFVTKPMAGTGAGLLIDSILLIATGAPGEAQTESANEEERRKSITAALINGTPYFWLDNVNHRLDSSAYASAATSERWRDRMLGKSQTVNIPVKLTWIFAGNNVSASNELSRRFVPIRLDAKSNPLARSDFRHRDLRGWIRAHRGELVWACLTIVRYWISIGMPLDTSNPRPSYEAWSAVFRGLLACIGGKAFLGNLDLLTEGVNEEMDAWTTFITLWANKHGLNTKRPVGNPDVGRGEWTGENSLVTLVRENAIELPMRGQDGIAQAKSLSRMLRGKVNNVFSVSLGGSKMDLALRRERDPVSNTMVFWLEKSE